MDLSELLQKELSVDEINETINQLKIKKRRLKRQEPAYKESMKQYQRRRRAYMKLMELKAIQAGITVTPEEVDEFLSRKQ
jgi:SMC interacting uncharacterized protein involved in chromosome segregation